MGAGPITYNRRRVRFALPLVVLALVLGVAPAAYADATTGGTSATGATSPTAPSPTSKQPA